MSNSDTPIIVASSGTEPFLDYVNDSLGDYTPSVGGHHNQKRASDERSDECHAPYPSEPVHTGEEISVYKHAHDRDAAEEDRRDGFCCQLGVTIKRMLILQIREPCSFVCELLIPIIFVCGSMILWAIFKNKKHEAMQYYDANNLANYTAFMSFITDLTCFNSSVVSSLGAFQDCDTLISSTPTLNVSKTPILCADALSGAPAGFCAVSTAVLGTYEYFIDLVYSNTTYIPSLDDIIHVQWLSRMLYDFAGLDTIWDRTDEAAIFSSGKLYVTPDTAETQSFVTYLQANSVYFPYVYAGTMSAAEATSAVQQRTNRDPPNWGILELENFTADDFGVKIRLNATALPKTKKMIQEYYVGGVTEDGPELYILSGFSTLQKTIYDYYFSEVLGITGPPTTTIALPGATVEYKDQQFLAYGGQMVPLILVLGFLYPVSQMTKRIVLEKELRLREAMLIMGLPQAVMYVGWLVIYVVEYFVVSIIIAILLKVTYVPKSNFGIVFFLFFFFCLSLISLSALMASFFNKARLSSILSPLIFFVLSIPLFAMQDSSGGARTGVMILSPSGMAVGVDILFDHELAGGMFSDSLTYFRDKPNMLVCLIFLFADFVIYAILMLYFDAVLPKDWGTRRNPLFFIIDPIRHCCCRGDDNYDNDEDGRAADGVFEEDLDSSEAAIRIVGVRKQYKRGGKKFLAVNNLHWCMREGEISVLLGHNGAGKTTTMNMMTGMIAADAGDCYVYGKSIRRDLKGARQEIGFCPQHNILWPNMTCEEHLWYYASIKGVTGERRDALIATMLEGVDLTDKATYRSAALSGGQKRKLSVAIAFVGGSRLIFLDEPTAGMDVGARRHTWGLLREMSKYHSILLTTHFMDEADLLGDTVAIMSKGRLQCAGSNMFLKSKLGVGYVLTLSVVQHVDRKRIAALIHEFIPDAEKLGSGAGEMAVRLPMASKAVFSDLLGSIEQNGKTYGITAYAMSATTLEEIFIKIATAEEVDREEKHLENTGESPAQEAEAKEEAAEAAPSDVWNVDLIHAESSIMWSQFKALMLKRFWNVLRDRRTQFFQIICPVACVLLAMLLMLVKIGQTPVIVLTTNLYESQVEVDLLGCPVVNPLSSLAISFEPSGVTTTAELSQYQLDTYYKHEAAEDRFSGIACSDAGVAALIYNASTNHEVGISMFNLYNMYYMQSTGDTSKTLRTEVDMMPKTEKEDEVTDSFYAMMIAIIIMIPFTFIPSTFVAWIVKERECKARHLQNVSGLLFSIYWLTNFLFDLACYLVTMFLVIIVFVIFNRREYIAPENAGATILVFLLYGLSGIAMAYALSFMFNEHSSAQNTVMLANFIAGFLLVLCISMLMLIDSTKDVAKILRWIFRIVPSYCVGEGISNLAVLKMEKAFGTDKTSLSMNVTGWPLVYMAIEVPFFVFITLFIDHPGRRQRSQRMFHNPDAEPEHIENEDPDVVAEREAVLNDPERASDLVAVKHLRKVYSNGKVAVRELTFGVQPGEVFGFLGTNGAGKTTAISILCQEFYPTSGHATVCGNDIVFESRAALRCIGYCPQFDATLDLLTVEEHLRLYAGVRAIAYAHRDRVVEGLLRLCELVDYRKTKSHELSGGNRRKLSVALSLIGGPRVVFLDEPSAGMDPVARRGLWTAVETVADNCAVVLTTHHLEEVEALAHRVAIMVDGALECIGNKTYLKSKFGTGFEVSLRIAVETEEVKKGVETFFEEKFPGSSIREYRARRFTYQISGDAKLSETFKLLEENSEALRVTDYNVSQTSIEQVFLQISEEAERRAEAEHEENLQKKKTCCSCC